MHLYGALLSPFVQRVLMAARAKGHEIELRPPLGGGVKSAEHVAIAANGRIPVLALDSGEHLCESGAIVAYLDDILPGPALMPADPLGRARVREIVALTTIELAAPIRPLLIHLAFGGPEAPQVVEAARAQLAFGRDALARLIGADALADGAPVTLADCILVPILALYRAVDRPTAAWRALTEQPAIAAYFDRALAHPLARRTIDEMDAGFAQMIPAADAAA